MRSASVVLATTLTALGALAPRASAQVVYLQNDSYTGVSFVCITGFDDEESVAARFTASPGQYPYTINRIRVLGCGAGGQGVYNISIYQDDGGGTSPGALLWQSAFDYVLTGTNVFDLDLTLEPTPPPAITSGTVRVELFTVITLGEGFGRDTDGITPTRNFIRSLGVWSFAEDQGVTGDWILRLGIVPAGGVQPSLSVSDASIAEGDTGTSQIAFTVSLSAPSAQTVTVNYATANGTATAGSDYAAVSGVATFDPGETSFPVAVTVNGDMADEPDETFSVVLSTPVNAVIGDGTGTGTILDDDGLNFFTLAPCRVLDTRQTQPLTANVDRTIPVTGLCGVPATAKAVSLNMAATGPTAPGFVRLFPAGGTPPVTAAINFSAGQTRSNNGIYGLGVGGSLTGRFGAASGTTHLILDVNGYFE